MNDCISFQEWDVRKVKVRWEIVEGLKFKTQVQAERWLFNYYKAENKGNLIRDKDRDLHPKKNEKAV